MSVRDKKFNAVSLESTRELLAKLEMAISIIAAFRIQRALTDAKLETEMARIERCVEHHYAYTNNINVDYNVFALNFVQIHAKALVYDPAYAGLYLQDMMKISVANDGITLLDKAV